jgi:hypothetical protein
MVAIIRFRLAADPKTLDQVDRATVGLCKPVLALAHFPNPVTGGL